MDQSNYTLMLMLNHFDKSVITAWTLLYQSTLKSVMKCQGPLFCCINMLSIVTIPHIPNKPFASTHRIFVLNYIELFMCEQGTYLCWIRLFVIINHKIRFPLIYYNNTPHHTTIKCGGLRLISFRNYSRVNFFCTEFCVLALL